MTQAEDDRGSFVPAAEGGGSVKSKRFLCYFVIWEPNKPPVIAEKVRVKRDTPEEREVFFNTEVTLPEALFERMARDHEFQTDVMAYCTQLGAEIISTSRVRISCPPNTTGTDGVQIFYSYKLGGQKRQEEVPADKLPADILALVRSDPNYQENEKYRAWYWRYAGKRRSEIVSEEARETFSGDVASNET